MKKGSVKGVKKRIIINNKGYMTVETSMLIVIIAVVILFVQYIVIIVTDAGTINEWANLQSEVIQYECLKNIKYVMTKR